jgi:hypothetical protein
MLRVAVAAVAAPRCRTWGVGARVEVHPEGDQKSNEEG